jgi:phosphotransferase system enzyme I (PtsI)
VRRLTGLAVSPGLAWGKAALLLQSRFALRYGVLAAHVDREVTRLDEAREATARQLRDIQAKVARSSGRDLSGLFDAQILMLDDQLLVPEARRLIAADHVNAEWALDRAFDQLCTLFMDTGDAYLRERRGDVADVVGRLRRNLRPESRGGRWRLDVDAPAILVADDLPPSLAGQIDRDLILGLAVDTGSRTHHTAILARSLRLPTVVGLGDATRHVPPGATVLVDGFTGDVIIDPTPAVIDEARERADRLARATVTAAAMANDSPHSRSADGVVVRFQANIERPEDAAAARAAGAEGIGLFRTEFLLASRAVERFDEDAQYAIYRDLVEQMAPHPVTVRTFDIDEAQAARDPRAGVADDAEPVRPFMPSGPMGLRAIRLSLRRPDLFGTQLRALVRASRHGLLRVLLPFVSGVEELRAAKAALEAARREVVSRTGAEVPPIPIGVMIEVPSAALTADLLAEEADFFSIGTNDLIQYCLAVDRTDGRVAGLFDPLHPAILRVVRQVTRVAARRRRGVSVCGEMAADPASLMLLLGLGVREFSMSAAAIPAARAVVRQVRLADLNRAGARALRLATGRDIHAFVLKELPALAARPSGRGARARKEEDR